jgi:hypothetical protein
MFEKSGKRRGGVKFTPTNPSSQCCGKVIAEAR